jgi:hypothetical protein
MNCGIAAVFITQNKQVKMPLNNLYDELKGILDVLREV